MNQIKLVGVTFHCAGKIFDFDAQSFDLAVGNQVIVETERGRALGKVVSQPRSVNPDQIPPKLKAVIRPATAADLELAENFNTREKEALTFCQQRISERRMEMKLVRAEYLFDGSKIIFYFTADGRVDFRELVRDLAQYFRTRIEMRQIGVRDEAKLVGGLGICGRELCCSNHLREFAPVSVKMAKAQGLALNPTKISGQCGRLLCCLAYEYETYNEFIKHLPKCGKKIQLDSGPAEVIALDILSQKVTLALLDGERRTLTRDELQLESEQKPRGGRTEPRPPKAESGQQGKGRSKREQGPQQRHKTPESPQPQQGVEPEPPNTESKNHEQEGKSSRRRRRPRRRSNRKSSDQS